MVVPCIAFLPLSYFLTDTPLWLTKQGRGEEAGAALARLRGPTYCAEPELKELEALLVESVVDAAPSLGTLLTRRSFLLPVSILSALFCLHASVGSDVLSYYALTLLIFPGVSASPSVLAVLLQTAFTLGMLGSPFVMARVNRRPQFIIGCLAIALHMFLLGLDTFFEISANNLSLCYLPFGLMISFGFSFGLGVGAVPYTLSGELFPQQMRSWGCGLALAVRYVFQFVQLKVFFGTVATFGMAGFYWVNACTALMGGAFAFALLPETRDKTFTELEAIFTAGRGQGGGGRV
jgi:SP family facilitated glucose transporter-like MFS transporter 8